MSGIFEPYMCHTKGHLGLKPLIHFSEFVSWGGSAKGEKQPSGSAWKLATKKIWWTGGFGIYKSHLLLQCDELLHSWPCQVGSWSGDVYYLPASFGLKWSWRGWMRIVKCQHLATVTTLRSNALEGWSSQITSLEDHWPHVSTHHSRIYWWFPVVRWNRMDASSVHGEAIEDPPWAVLYSTCLYRSSCHIINKDYEIFIVRIPVFYQ